MADPSFYDAVRLPSELLIALDWRPYHFAIQPYHYIVRLVHLASMGAFFGGIALLDLRLMGWRGTVPLKGFAEHALPWLMATFAVTFVTGVMLLLFDPLKIGSKAYFMPKLIALALGLLNAGLFHRAFYLKAVAAEGMPPASARIAGAASLVLWTAVVVYSSLNVENAPRVLLSLS